MVHIVVDVPFRPHPRLLAGAWCLWVAIALLAPAGGGGESWLPELPGVDKAGHFGLFFVQVVLLWRAASDTRGKLAAIVVATGVYSLALETLQRWIPGRAFDWRDGLANLAGVLMAAVVVTLWRQRSVGRASR